MLPASSVLMALRYFKKITADGTPFEAITRDLIIEQLTGKAVTPEIVAAARDTTLENWAAARGSKYNAEKGVLTLRSKGTRAKAARALHRKR